MRMVAVGCVHLVGCFWALSPRPETVVQHLLHFVTLNGLLFLTKHRVEALFWVFYFCKQSWGSAGQLKIFLHISQQCYGCEPNDVETSAIAKCMESS